MSKCPPQIQTYYTRYVHATYSRAGVLARNVQQEFFVPTSIMCGAYAPRMRDLRVECWECELNENKFYFGGKHTRIYQFMLKFFQYSQHKSLRYAQVTRTWHLRGTQVLPNMEKILRHAWCKMFWNCFRFLSYNRSTRTLIAATRARLAWASQGNLPFFARRPVVEARTTNCKWANFITGGISSSLSA